MRTAACTMVLASAALLAFGVSSARAQAGPYYYYPASGDYATTQGTVHIPNAGYYSNEPLSAVPVERRSSPIPMVNASYANGGLPARGSAFQEPVTRQPVAPPPAYVAPPARYYYPATVGTYRTTPEQDFSWMFKN